MFIKIN